MYAFQITILISSSNVSELQGYLCMADGEVIANESTDLLSTARRYHSGQIIVFNHAKQAWTRMHFKDNINLTISIY